MEKLVRWSCLRVVVVALRMYWETSEVLELVRVQALALLVSGFANVAESVFPLLAS